MFQVEIPVEFKGKTYEAVFEYFGVNKSWLVLGLYRSAYEFGKRRTLFNRLPYVYTNPQSSTRIMEGDKVFIIGRQETQNQI